MTRIRTTRFGALVAAASIGCGASGSATTEPPAADVGPHDAGTSVAIAPGAGTGQGAPPTPPAPSPEDAAAPTVPDAAAPAPDPACAQTSAWKPGADQTITLAHDGRSRSYLVHVGKKVDAKATPLVVNFHGLNNSPTIQAAFSEMSPLADQEGFIVVYPQGLNVSFNAGSCCGTSAQQGIDDVGFARALIADVESKICVDRKRVYATGFSNGGFMAYRLACEVSDLFAAVAPVSGNNGSPTCAPTHPMPLIAFHGTGDPVVSFANGEAAVHDWVKREGCTGDPKRTSVGASYCDEWSTCDGGAKVKLCAIAGGTHLWPGATASIPASPAIWQFFQQFALP